MRKQVDGGRGALRGVDPAGFHVWNFKRIANGLHVMSAIGGPRTKYCGHAQSSNRAGRLDA